MDLYCLNFSSVDQREDGHRNGQYKWHWLRIHVIICMVVGNQTHDLAQSVLCHLHTYVYAYMYTSSCDTQHPRGPRLRPPRIQDRVGVAKNTTSIAVCQSTPSHQVTARSTIATKAEDSSTERDSNSLAQRTHTEHDYSEGDEYR